MVTGICSFYYSEEMYSPVSIKEKAISFVKIYTIYFILLRKDCNLLVESRVSGCRYSGRFWFTVSPISVSQTRDEIEM